ncbi:MinD/ParA family ATP-binding protein [Haloglomus halophilum]|uniref:MinD/ParA family ATP-binding protein n=1 Tax=Haloglomus halophilum TaxID=2962672 RepID=UPI0020C947B1|nr:AAA family ATPase [Haloglomus halophilum]
MDIYAVAGADGAGKTATALNVAVAFRAGGQYAAVLDADLRGNVASRLGIEPEHTLDDVFDGDATIREATTEYELSAETVPEADLLAYREALADDRTAFRAGDEEFAGVDETEFPDIDTVPVIAGWPSDRRVAATDPDELEDVLQELVMAYDAVIIDTGGESVAATAPVTVADGVAVVTSTDESHIQTSNATAIECQRNGASLVGTVVNRADEQTTVTAVTDEVGVEAVGVIPEDSRTADLEPVRYSVPDAPAAKAYDRLADGLEEWSRAVEAEADSAADGGGPGASGAGTDPETDAKAPGEGDEHGADDESDEGDDGLLGRFGLD